MSKTIDQRNNDTGFVKPGELINIRPSSELSMHDRRVFNLLVQNAWLRITEDIEHEIAIQALRGPTHKGKERVADSVDILMTTLVEVPAMLSGEKAVEKTQLLADNIQTIDEDSPNAVLRYRFPKKLQEIIEHSNYWGRLKAHVMFAFTSKYALALYEALCLRANLQVSEQVISVEAFRHLLGVTDGQYGLFKSLNQRVIEPAVREINGLSDFWVEIEPIRHSGRQRGPIREYRLTWRRKDKEEWHDVLKELLQPKIGRTARLAGTVEHVAA